MANLILVQVVHRDQAKSKVKGDEEQSYPPGGYLFLTFSPRSYTPVSKRHDEELGFLNKSTMHVDTTRMNEMHRRRGRPPHDRDELLDLLRHLPRRGRNLVRINQCEAARKLGWHQATVQRAINDLERDGAVRRFSRLGHQGSILELLDGNTRRHDS